MRNRLLMWCASVALLLATDALARTAEQEQTARPPAAIGSVASVTATGCLEPWRSREADPSLGTPPAEPPAGVDYMLTGVEGRAVPAAAAGTRASAMDGDARLLLLSAPGIDFKAHVNQTVKIVGTIAPQPSEGASPAEHAADPSRSETNLPPGPPSEAFRLNLVEVSSLTVVAKKCGK